MDYAESFLFYYVSLIVYVYLYRETFILPRYIGYHSE